MIIYVRIFFGSINDHNLILHAGMGLPPVEYGQVITMIYLKVAIYASPRLPSPFISLPLLCVCTFVRVFTYTHKPRLMQAPFSRAPFSRVIVFVDD